MVRTGDRPWFVNWCVLAHRAKQRAYRVWSRSKTQADFDECRVAHSCNSVRFRAGLSWWEALAHFGGRFSLNFLISSLSIYFACSIFILTSTYSVCIVYRGKRSLLTTLHNHHLLIRVVRLSRHFCFSTNIKEALLLFYFYQRPKLR